MAEAVPAGDPFAQPPEWRQFTRPARRERAAAAQLWGWALVIALAGSIGRIVWFWLARDGYAVAPGGEPELGLAWFYAAGGLTGDHSGMFVAGPALEQAPGYSLLIAAVSSLPGLGDPLNDTLVADVVVGLQWVLALATVLICFALARRVLLGWTALLPLMLLSLSIGWLDMPSTINSETLLAFLIAAALLLFTKGRERRPPGGAPPSGRADAQILSGAFVISVALLVEPRLLIVLPFLLVWCARGMRPTLAVAMLVISLLLPAAWTARNVAVEDKLVFVPAGQRGLPYDDGIDPAKLPDRAYAAVSPWSEPYARGPYDVPEWDHRRLVPQAISAKPWFETAGLGALAVWLAVYLLLIAGGVRSLWSEGPGSPARLLAIPLLAAPIALVYYDAGNHDRLPFLPLLAIAMTLGMVSSAELLRGRPRE